MLRWKCVRQSHTRRLWASSVSVAARCGWVKVCQFISLPVGLTLRSHYSLRLTEQWGKASSDFFESFRNYDESGSPQRIQVLKYLVLANMLMASDINPFDSQETKP